MGYKLYAWTNQHFYLYTTQIAAKLAGIECAFEQKPYGKSEDKDWNAKKGHMSYPILELDDGRMISQTNAVCSYLLKVGGKADMLGSSAWEAAQVNHWTSFVTTTVDEQWKGIILPAFGMGGDKDTWEAAIAWFSKELSAWEAHLDGHTHWVGDNMTLADIIMWRICFCLFSFVIGPDQRASLPNLTAWYGRMKDNEHVVAVAGKYHMTAEPWKMFGSDATLSFNVNEEEAKAAPEEEEDDDLFGSDDDDDQDARMELKAKAHEAKFGKKVKAVVIAKSLVIFEVKPLDDETNLDVLGARIIKEVAMDGLTWKTEFKKVPVAYGIFKIQIGCTIEDDKVSTDDLTEQIEAMDDMVQSVDIAAFNKL